MALDPEMQKIAKEASRIVMPYAWERRDAMEKAKQRFVHYTSAAAGLNIIRTKSIWMRNTTCMADYSEVQHGLKKLTAEKNLKPLIEFLDSEVSGVGREAVNLFDSWSNDTQFGTYIASISAHDDKEDVHGRLSMWRAFGGQTARVAFVLKIPENDVVGALLNLWISPVAYFSDAELSQELQRVLQNVRENRDALRQMPRQIIIGAIFYMLVSAVVCLKHDGFHEEREWRLVHSPKRMPSKFMQSSIETVAGVPQHIYKIPIGGGPPDELNEIKIENLLDRVIIGPSPYPWAMYEAFVSALTDAGVSDAGKKVFVSGIPIRA